jgi:hypothetical protein
MAGKFSEEQIATTLNRLRLRTGANNAWNEMRVYPVRHRYQLRGGYASSTTLCFSPIVQRRRFFPRPEVSTSRLVDTNKVCTKAIISTLSYLVETAFERRLRTRFVSFE